MVLRTFFGTLFKILLGGVQWAEYRRKLLEVVKTNLTIVFIILMLEITTKYIFQVITSSSIQCFAFIIHWTQVVGKSQKLNFNYHFCKM